MFFKNSLDFQTRDWAHYHFISLTTDHWGSCPVSSGPVSSVYRRHRSNTAASDEGDNPRSVATRTGPLIQPF